MKKCFIMFVFFVLSLFTALIFGGIEENRQRDKQNMVVASYVQTTETNSE